MSLELSHYDRCNEWRRVWRLHVSLPYVGRYWLWDNFVRPFTHSAYFWPVHINLWTREGGNCYCPSGSATEVGAVFFGLTIRLWCVRDRGHYPCGCDIALYDAGLLDADCIEDKGGAAAFELAREWWERFCKSKSPTRYRGTVFPVPTRSAA